MSYIHQTFHIDVEKYVSWPMKGFQSFPQQDSISSLERKLQVPLSKIDQNGIKNNKKKSELN